MVTYMYTSEFHTQEHIVFFFLGKWLPMAKDFGVPRFFSTLSMIFVAQEYNAAILNREATDQYSL